MGRNIFLIDDLRNIPSTHALGAKYDEIKGENAVDLFSTRATSLQSAIGRMQFEIFFRLAHSSGNAMTKGTEFLFQRCKIRLI